MIRRIVWATALKDLRRRMADRLALVLWLGVPVVIGVLMWLVSGGSGSSPRGVVLLADEDGGVVGTAIKTSLTRGSLGSLWAIEEVTADEGRARLEAGGASALLIVPKGATRAFLDRTPATLRLVKNPAQRILPGIVEETSEVLVEAGFYIQRVFDEPLRTMSDQPVNADGFPADANVAALATAINTRLRDVRPLLFPPVLEVKVEQADSAGTQVTPFDLARTFLPGLVFMSLLFIAQGMTGDLWDEHAAGTLRRALRAPGGAPAFLLGKLLATAVLMGAIAMVALLVAVLLFDVPVLRAAASWPWTVFGGTVLVALFLVPQLLASSRRGADMLSNLVVFPLMMIGGSFFPFEAMPAWMAAVGRWTPNGQAVLRLKDLLGGSVDLTALAMAIVAMAVPAAAAVVWATRRMHAKFGGG